jgi:hypothetical protein
MPAIPFDTVQANETLLLQRTPRLCATHGTYRVFCEGYVPFWRIRLMCDIFPEIHTRESYPHVFIQEHGTCTLASSAKLQRALVAHNINISSQHGPVRNLTLLYLTHRTPVRSVFCRPTAATRMLTCCYPSE